MPDGAIYVGRPTRWGNPYAIAAVAMTSGIEQIGEVPGLKSVAIASTAPASRSSDR